MEILIKNIKFTRGNSYGLQLELNTTIGEIKNVKFCVKDSVDNIKIEKKLNDGITLEDKFLTLRLKPNDTKNLIENTEYKYEMKIDYGTDDIVSIVKGAFIVDWSIID